MNQDWRVDQVGNAKDWNPASNGNTSSAVWRGHVEYVAWEVGAGWPPVGQGEMRTYYSHDGCNCHCGMKREADTGFSAHLDCLPNACISGGRQAPPGTLPRPTGPPSAACSS